MPALALADSLLFSAVLCSTLPLAAPSAVDGTLPGGDAGLRCSGGVQAAFCDEGGADDQDIAPLLQTKRLEGRGPTAFDHALEVGAGAQWAVKVPFQRFAEEVGASSATPHHRDIRLVFNFERFMAMMHSAAVFFTVAIFCLGTQLLVTECLDACFQIDPWEVADWLTGRCRDSSQAVKILATSLRFGCSWVHRAIPFRSFVRRRLDACFGRRPEPLEADFASLLPIVREVAVFLEPEDVSRWGSAACAYRGLPDEFCNYPVLLKELQRLDAEREWFASMQATDSEERRGMAAECPPQADCSGEAYGGSATKSFAGRPAGASDRLPALRRFLGESRRRHTERERAEALGRCSEMFGNLARSALLAVCWLCFFCQVIGLAESPPSVTSGMTLFKALVSPALFLFVLESVEEHLGRASVAGAVALLLLLDCAATGRCHGGGCAPQPTAEFHSFAPRLPVR